MPGERVSMRKIREVLRLWGLWILCPMASFEVALFVEDVGSRRRAMMEKATAVIAPPSSSPEPPTPSGIGSIGG